MEHIKMSWNWI